MSSLGRANLSDARMGLPPAPDVPCSGCGEPTPYDAGPEDSTAPSYIEALRTPLGWTFARTHRRRECVKASRERLGGKARPWPKLKTDLNPDGQRPTTGP